MLFFLIGAVHYDVFYMRMVLLMCRRCDESAKVVSAEGTCSYDLQIGALSAASSATFAAYRTFSHTASKGSFFVISVYSDLIWLHLMFLFVTFSAFSGFITVWNLPGRQALK